MEIDVFKRGILAACSAAQFGKRAFGQKLAALNDADSVSDTLGDIEDVRGENDGADAARTLLQQILDLAGDGRVETC